MTEPCGIVSVLTDFGLTDPYAGVMTAAMLRHAPTLHIVPLTHAVPPQAVAQASLWLALSYEYFPKGTVHLAVVDPGVGSDRDIVAVQANEHFFVAPDNGLLDDALTNGATSQVRQVDLRRLGLIARGPTFHGRDLFAPIAAMLASGTHSLEDLGNATTARPCVAPKPLQTEPNRWRGEVVAIDHFGNALTNLSGRTSPPAKVRLTSGWLNVAPAYSAVAEGSALAIVNSWNLVEIAVRNGHAARQLRIQIGDTVLAETAQHPSTPLPTDALPNR